MTLSFKKYASIVTILILIVFVGCSGKSIEDGDPGELIQEAEQNIKSDHYQLAIERLRIVKNKYPYSKYAVDAQLRIADVYYLQESFGEAALSYEGFRDLHPKHEKVAYAMFRVGKSYFNDRPGNVARDLTPNQKSFDAYNEFIKRFPEAPQASDARADIKILREELAEKELYIAKFYTREDQAESAKRRYTKLIDAYPETQAAETAKKNLEKLQDNKN